MYYLLASLALTAFVGGGAYISNHSDYQKPEEKQDSKSEVVASSTTSTSVESSTEVKDGHDDLGNETSVNAHGSLFLGL